MTNSHFKIIVWYCKFLEKIILSTHTSRVAKDLNIFCNLHSIHNKIRKTQGVVYRHCLQISITIAYNDWSYEKNCVLFYSKAPEITFLAWRTGFWKLSVKYKKITLVMALVIGIENTFSAQKWLSYGPNTFFYSSGYFN